MPNCQPPPAPGVPVCGSEGLHALSYPLPARWPLDAFQLVMENAPGTCNFYRHGTSTCCRFTTDFNEPERHVREAVVSFLSGCGHRPASRACRAVDLGANNGWFTAMMLQLGATVTSVEPQTDLAWATRKTAELNCWGARSTVHNARACVPPEYGGVRSCFEPVNASTCDVGGWRWGSGPSAITKQHGADCARATGLPETVGGVDLVALLLDTARAPPGGGAGPRELDLLKMDADGPEGVWLRLLEQLASEGKLSVGAIIVEGSHLEPTVLRKLDVTHGYTTYRLDEHDSRRLISRDGWDAYSPPGTYGRLERLAEQHKPQDAQLVKYSISAAMRRAAAEADGSSQPLKPAADGVSRLQLEDELLAIRNMRHVFRLKRNLSALHWVTVLNPVLPKGYPPQLVLTKEPDLTEPTFPSVGERASPEYKAAVESDWWRGRKGGAHGGAATR